MGDSSGGENRGVRKKAILNVQKQKERSYSLGSINLNENEEFIGFEPAKKLQKIRTYHDRTDKGEKNTTSGGVQVININNSEEVFKPTNSISRSPLKPLDNKRPRSGSSPTLLNRNKMRKQFDSTQSQDERSTAKLQKPEQTVENLTTEDAQNKILDALSTIHVCTSKETNNEIILTTGAQMSINSALFTIHTNVTKLAYRVGLTENCNIQLKTKQRQYTNNGYEYECEKKKTYSTVTKNVLPDTDTPQTTTKTAEWKTPTKTTKKLETLIKIKDQRDSKVVLQELKKTWMVLLQK